MLLIGIAISSFALASSIWLAISLYNLFELIRWLKVLEVTGTWRGSP